MSWMGSQEDISESFPSAATLEHMNAMMVGDATPTINDVTDCKDGSDEDNHHCGKIYYVTQALYNVLDKISIGQGK